MMPDLLPGQVHVWTIPLEQTREAAAKLENVLAEEEQRRASGFVVDEPRRRFVAGRGALRILLGRYLNIEPQIVQFTSNPYGKPFLTPGIKTGGLEFNLTHTRRLVLAAFARGCRVGIDVEWLREINEFNEIAARFFTAGENAALGNIPENKRLAAFYEYWTCKEAFIKAIGEGVSHPLDSFEIEFKDEGAPHLHRLDQQASDSKLWTIKIFKPGAGYSAALAVEAAQINVEFYTFKG
jgi:4'-phosphopantetheinyl transferase